MGPVATAQISAAMLNHATAQRAISGRRWLYVTLAWRRTSALISSAGGHAADLTMQQATSVRKRGGEYSLCLVVH